MVDAIDAGVIDLALGGGSRGFFPNGITDENGGAGRRLDRNLVEEIKAKGWQYAWNRETTMAADPNKPLLGLYGESHMNYEADRPETEPSLADMTEVAIKNLEDAENGYYLMIEGGRVDHANHAGNMARAVTDGEAFALAIEKALSMVNTDDTLVIVTADHGHGLEFNGYCGRGTPITGLCYDVDDHGNAHSENLAKGLDGKPYTVAGYMNGPGSVMVGEEGANDWTGTRKTPTQEEAQNIDYLQDALVPMTAESHSAVDVPIMATGPWAHLLGGVVEQNVIFHVMLKAVTSEG